MTESLPEENQSTFREDGLKREYPNRFRRTKFDLIGCLILFIMATVLMLPIFARGLPNGDDASTHYRLTADFIEAMSEGSVYPRWLPRSNFGQGSPVMLYYPPLPFYVASAFNALVRDPMRALTLGCWLGMALSGLTMYVFGKSIFPRWIALLTALLYMAVPYHIFDLYYRSALSEYWSFAWLPLVFDATQRVASGRGWRAAAYLACAYSLMLLTHVLISFQITLLLPIYFLLQTRRLRRIVKAAAGLATGVLVSAVFVVPLLFEWDYVRLDRALRIPFSRFFLFENVISAIRLHRFLTPAEHSFYFGEALDLVSIGMPLLLVTSALVIWRKRNLIEEPLSKAFVVSVGAVAGLSLLLTTRLSAPVWQAWSQLHYIQFPFRWLTITASTAVILAGVAVSLLARERELRLVFGASLAAAAIINVSISVLAVAQASYDRNLLEQGLTGVEVAEYRTVWRDRQKHLDETLKPAVTTTSGAASISVIDDSGRWQNYIVNASTQSTLTLRTYYFPGWVARLDGQSVEVTPSNEGNIQLLIEPGQHALTLSFEDTWPRTAGKLVSGAGLLALLILLGLGRVGRSREISLTDFDGSNQNDAR